MTDRELAVAVARAVGCSVIDAEPDGPFCGCPWTQEIEVSQFHNRLLSQAVTNISVAWSAAVTFNENFRLVYFPPGEADRDAVHGAYFADHEESWYGEDPLGSRALCRAIVKAAEKK